MKRTRHVLLFVFAICSAAILNTGCGANGSSSSGGGSNPTPIGSPSQAGTVFIVVMENKNYADVVGNSAMPFFNSLIPQGALATNYYADLHPSIGNYMMLTTGLPVPADDSFAGVVTSDNIARQLVSAGKTWKVYVENLPSVGYTGGDQMPYLRRHNPFSYFSDIVNNSAQAANMVPFSQFTTDLSSGNLPNLAFIVPNAFDDGHSCPTSNCTTTMELQQSDAWMSQVLPGIIGSAAFKNNGVLAITWDESATDATNGGGKVATLFLGPQAKAGYQSTTSYQHQDLLRMICFRIGLASCPGAASSASTMSEFFQ
jgi:phosphatidylinositol-3-phosphatase